MGCARLGTQLTRVNWTGHMDAFYANCPCALLARARTPWPRQTPVLCYVWTERSRDGIRLCKGPPHQPQRLSNCEELAARPLHVHPACTRASHTCSQPRLCCATPVSLAQLVAAVVFESSHKQLGLHLRDNKSTWPKRRERSPSSLRQQPL